MRIVFLAVPAVLAAQQPTQQPADLIITNARIYTVDESHPLADARWRCAAGKCSSSGRRTTSYDDVIARVAERANTVPAGTWITGRGWDQNDWGNTATRDPAGGHIERAANGAPAGVFVDNAQGLVDRVVPGPTRDEVKAEVQTAIAEAQKWGLTGVHDAGASSQVLDIYAELGKAGQLNFRLYAMIGSVIEH